MKAIRLSSLVLVLSALAALSVPVARADDAAQMYDPSTVYVIDLDLPQASLDELELNPTEEYVQGFLTLTPTDGTPGSEGSPLVDAMEVGIRLKGSKGGSFRDLEDGKAAFKVKCNFVSGKKCLGLKKMTLNNMVQDPSMLHETLAYSAFRAVGVPAARTGFAYVRVNGEDFGLYLNLETYDDVFLKRQFTAFDEDVQHLYEGEVGDDVFPGGAALFEIDEGPDDRGDLEALVDATNESGGSFSTRVVSHANLAEMTKMWAVEKYIDHWDGYAGHTDPEQAAKGERPNNYYLYSELSGRFQMLPWGTDQAWIPTADAPGRIVTFDGSGGVLFNKCIEDEGCFRSYWEALQEVVDAVAALDPVTLAQDTASLLLPWQEGEVLNSAREEHDIGDIEDGVEETLEFAAGRQAEAEAWLEANEPPPPAESLGSGTSVDSTGQRQDSGDSGPEVAFERARLSGRRLTTRVQLSGPGRVSLHATFKAGKKRKRACETSKPAPAAGGFALRCSLSPAAMERLSYRALRLRLTIAIALADGTDETVVQSIRLPRT